MRHFVTALLYVLLSAIVMALPAGASDPWAHLYRPLHLPAVVPGAACPVSAIGHINFARYGVGVGIGPGPVYPVGLGQPGSTLQLTNFEGSKWGGQKVLWFVAPIYRGRVLIRGGGLDAAGVVRFDRGTFPTDELRIRIGEHGGNPPGYALVGQRYRPSYTRLREPGCYAYQVDGTNFSRVVVFSALRVA